MHFLCLSMIQVDDRADQYSSHEPSISSRQSSSYQVSRVSISLRVPTPQPYLQEGAMRPPMMLRSSSRVTSSHHSDSLSVASQIPSGVPIWINRSVTILSEIVHMTIVSSEKIGNLSTFSRLRSHSQVDHRYASETSRGSNASTRVLRRIG